MVKEKEAFSKTKIKGDPKSSNCGGKTSMHKLTSILDFFKTEYRPLSGDFIAAYGILLLAILTNGYSCELVYDRTMGGGSCLI